LKKIEKAHMIKPIHLEQRIYQLSILRGSVLFIIVLLFIFHGSCSQGHAPIDDQQTTLLLCQAQFEQIRGEDGKDHPVPGAAKLLMVYLTSKGWKSEALEDTESNVFHKAIPWGEDFLTIGANAAVLKLWTREGRKWMGKTLWKPSFGGENDRLRDIEMGDVTGDGKDDLVIATHDQGVVAVLQKTGDSWDVTELNRSPQTFVHEIEIGDVNNDGVKEFFATPSAPNKVDGTPQPGAIQMFRYNGKSFEQHIIEEFPKRHVKEILVADVNKSGYPDLFAVLEAEMKQVGGEQQIVDTVKIKQYHYENGVYAGRIIADLPDVYCRFLNFGDVDGDGNLDLIASAFKSGLWVLRKNNNEWQKELIDRDSSGFEHATLVLDMDKDGVCEIYVAADDQGALRKYQWDGKKFKRQDLIPLPGGNITFNVTYF
jgi:hypothetical protein